MGANKLLSTIHWLKTNFLVKVILQPTISRPVYPGVRPQLGPVTNFSFSSKFSLDSCRFFYSMVPSLTRGCVCNLLLLLGLASGDPNFLGSPNLEGHVPIFVFPRDKVALLYPWALGLKSKLKLLYD
jgi:hypothetical protein